LTGGSTAPHEPASSLGLPRSIRACLFDLDGVLTQTRLLHTAAWRQIFDTYLEARAARQLEPFVPFDPVADYGEYVDGKQSPDGVRSFLSSRQIELPEGASDDPPERETVAALGTRKNEVVLAMLKRQGVAVYAGSSRYLEAARDAGLRRAVVSSSANCVEVLRAAGIDDLIEEHVDATVAAQLHLRGKPAPDTFLAAAEILEVPTRHAAVFEDSLAGVEAGRAGGFALVVGIDRVGRPDALRAHGADIVVSDLAELLPTQTFGAAAR
jgi:beta-phosphoglucomutase family hydrolase